MSSSVFSSSGREEGSFGRSVKNNHLFSYWIPQCALYYYCSSFFAPEAGRRCYVGIAMERDLLVAS